jgi:rod shape determining protein RodA
MLANIFFTSLLIIKQPDLGTGLIVMMSGLCLLFIMGLPRRIILWGMLLFCISCPLVWHNLHDYQKKRIQVFLGYGESHRERYQLEQSKIAVGSGGIYGKGFLQGTQKNLQFLPENRTDFIFAVLAEEFGFMGVCYILLLYIILFWFIFITSKKIIHCYASYLLYYGMFTSFMISVICNIAMVIGLLPVVGIPLPCMSYGITHVWGTSILFGVLMSILKYGQNT